MGSPLISLLPVAAVGALFLTSCTTALSSRNGAIGTRVTRLPMLSERFESDGTIYYRSGSDYFIRRDDHFVLVNSPRSTLREKASMTRRF